MNTVAAVLIAAPLRTWSMTIDIVGSRLIRVTTVKVADITAYLLLSESFSFNVMYFQSFAA